MWPTITYSMTKELPQLFIKKGKLILKTINGVNIFVFQVQFFSLSFSSPLFYSKHKYASLFQDKTKLTGDWLCAWKEKKAAFP